MKKNFFFCNNGWPKCLNRQISLHTWLEKHMAATNFFIIKEKLFHVRIILIKLFTKLDLIRQSNFSAALPNHQLFRNTFQWKKYFPIKFVIHVSSPSLKDRPFSNKLCLYLKTTFEHKMKNEKYISGEFVEESGG